MTRHRARPVIRPSGERTSAPPHGRARDLANGLGPAENLGGASPCRAVRLRRSRSRGRAAPRHVLLESTPVSACSPVNPSRSQRTMRRAHAPAHAGSPSERKVNPRARSVAFPSAWAAEHLRSSLEEHLRSSLEEVRERSCVCSALSGGALCMGRSAPATGAMRGIVGAFAAVRCAPAPECSARSAADELLERVASARGAD